MERRDLLYGSASALAIAVAGCTGRAQEDDNETTDNETTDGGDASNESETTDEETDDESADDAGDEGDDSADDEDDHDSEADYDDDPEGVSGFDAGGFSVGGDALTVEWMECEEGVLVVDAVVDTTREDLLEDVPVSAEGLRMLSEMDPESISAEDAEEIDAEQVEPMLEGIEPMLMDLVESVPMDTVESIDDMEGFSTDIHQVRFTLCDHTSTELLSFTIDVQWMLDVVDDLMEDEEFVASVRETVEYLVDDEELVARVLATLEQ